MDKLAKATQNAAHNAIGALQALAARWRAHRAAAELRRWTATTWEEISSQRRQVSWLFVTLDDAGFGTHCHDFYHTIYAAATTRWRSKAKLARP
jgi:hypothetical protein